MTFVNESKGQPLTLKDAQRNPLGAQRRLRPDIQGLRAFAVLAVIAFHAGLPVPGGFVGVDVFFVISGYVITGMLGGERLAVGRVRFGHFYARRMARLIPALGLLVGVTCLAASFLLSPLGVQQLTAKTGAAGMLSLANGAISVSSGGYFLGPAEQNPLLNLWSLSVEEQFYYVFPLVLAIGWLLGRRFQARWMALALVLMLACLSYVLMAVSVGTDSLSHSYLQASTVPFPVRGSLQQELRSPLSLLERRANLVTELLVKCLEFSVLPCFSRPFGSSSQAICIPTKSRCCLSLARSL